MPAYLIARVAVTDRDAYKKYLEATPAIIEKYGGKVLFRPGEIATFEGPVENRRIVIIEFPSLIKAKQWYESLEYQEAKKLREGAAEGEIIAVEG